MPIIPDNNPDSVFAFLERLFKNRLNEDTKQFWEETKEELKKLEEEAEEAAKNDAIHNKDGESKLYVRGKSVKSWPVK